MHLIKPNPTSESKRGCCFVTFATAASAEEAIKALNGQVCEALGTAMPLLVRVADPPRSREEQRSRTAQQHAAQRMPAQVGVLPGWPGALGYGWPGPQAQGAFAGAQGGQPFFLAPGGSPGAQAAGAQYMGVFPGGYGFGMLPQFAQTQHGEWSEHADSEGNKYYYNSQSGVSQWEPPAHWPAQQAAQLPMMYPYAQAMPAGCARRALSLSRARARCGAARDQPAIGSARAPHLRTRPPCRLAAVAATASPAGDRAPVRQRGVRAGLATPRHGPQPRLRFRQLRERARGGERSRGDPRTGGAGTLAPRGEGEGGRGAAAREVRRRGALHRLAVQARSLRVEKMQAGEGPPRAR